MAKQNVYDNQEFFEGYKSLREKEVNANKLFEMPALFSLLPDLKDKEVLDLGCGFGEHCMEYVRRGACKVTGIDISEKMLEVARKENNDPRIHYVNLPMEELGKLKALDKAGGKFDVVISSLAFHYVEDFSGVVHEIHELLNDDGVFVFSQESPLCSCYSGKESRWTKDENGTKLYLNFKDYGVEGEKESTWFIEGVKKYHRMFSTIINALANNGFLVERLIEPLPDEKLLKKYPEYYDLFHKPDFLVVKAVKR